MTGRGAVPGTLLSPAFLSGRERRRWDHTKNKVDCLALSKPLEIRPWSIFCSVG